MLFKLWFNAVLSGAVAGTLVGLIAGDFFAGLLCGGVVAGICSLIGGHIFRGDDENAIAAFTSSIPYSGFVGGISSAIMTDAGFLGAFVGAGVGFVAGGIIGALLFDEN